MHKNWIERMDRNHCPPNKKKVITKDNFKKIIQNDFFTNNLDSKEFYGIKTIDIHKNISTNFQFIETGPIQPTKVEIDANINSISDIIKIVDQYPVRSNETYNIPLKKLHDITPYLKELDNMIGIDILKKQLLEQMLYFIQDLHLNNSNDSEYLHTILAGPPGTGKTAVAEIIGKIYSHVGILKKKTFKKVTRSDLIGGYLGQTALKTKDVIKDSLGGVLFIDEAYALGNPEKRDSFSKECIDTLCEALSHYKDKLMVIIAGYDEELQNCFFAYNQGLASRFIWKFKIDKYTSGELAAIFSKKIKDAEWQIEDGIGDEKWFEKNHLWFPSYGRDIENLITKIKICHSKRIFGDSKAIKKKINKNDLDKGFELYSDNDNLKKNLEKNQMSKSLCSIYV